MSGPTGFEAIEALIAEAPALARPRGRRARARARAAPGRARPTSSPPTPGSPTCASTATSSAATACWSAGSRTSPGEPTPDRDSVARMTLWPEEYEGMRDEARATATGDRRDVRRRRVERAVSTDRDERVRAQREMMKAFEAVSPAGVDRDIAGVPCRVFRPERPARAVYLHFHGGAMILGSPLMNDVANADLSSRFDLAVVSVDYRLAPEHPHPAGLRRLPGGRALAGRARRSRVRHAARPDRRRVGRRLLRRAHAAAHPRRARRHRPRRRRQPRVRGLRPRRARRRSVAPGRPTSPTSSTDDVWARSSTSASCPGRTPDDCKVAEHLAALRRPRTTCRRRSSPSAAPTTSSTTASSWPRAGRRTATRRSSRCIPTASTPSPAFPTELAKRANERIDAFLERVLG